MKSPLSEVKERFGDKAKLVAAVRALATKELWLDRTNDAKSLENVSNRKLLRLHDVLSRAKNDFGSREKLIAAILESQKRSKDAGLQKRLEAYPLPRLLDLHAAAKKSAKRASA